MRYCLAGGLWIKAESVTIQIEALGPLHLGSPDKMFSKNVFMKNARNRKSILEVAKWPTLRPLKIYRISMVETQVLLSINTSFSFFKKIQTVLKSQTWPYLYF